MVRVRELPRAEGFPLLTHTFEVIDHLLGLSGLFEAGREESFKVVDVGRVSLDIDA